MTPLGTCVKLLWFASSSSQWSLAEDSPQGPDYIICSSPIKWSSAVLLLVTSGCCRISSGWRFALFCGGCYIIDFIVHVSSYFLQSTLHCSCLILFPSVHTSLFMFHVSSVSSHFIVNVSLLFPSVHCPSHSFRLSQSMSFIFALFGCIHITWSFNHIISFTFRPILSLGICGLRVSLNEFLILDRHLLLEAGLRWFYCSLSLCVGREEWG